MDVFTSVPIEGGVALVVQAPTTAEPSVVEAGRAIDVAERAVASFEDAIDSIRDAAQAAVHRLVRTPLPPSDVTIEFGVQLAAEAGVVIAQTTATANMKLVFHWALGEK